MFIMDDLNRNRTAGIRLALADIYDRIKSGEVSEDMFTPDKTGAKTLEILGCQFTADEPAIFGTPNKDYIEREIEWYESKSLNVNDIPGKTPKIWTQVSDDDGYINSNYGWCIYSSENYNQFLNCFETLKNDPSSRRAQMIYTRPSMQYDYNKNGMSDFMCTDTVQYFIRKAPGGGDGLVAKVNMRSNDVVFGYKNDWAWQQHVAKELAHILGLKQIFMIWNVGSMHIYDRHFHIIEDYLKTDEYKEYKERMNNNNG